MVTLGILHAGNFIEYGEIADPSDPGEGPQYVVGMVESSKLVVQVEKPIAVEVPAMEVSVVEKGHKDQDKKGQIEKSAVGMVEFEKSSVQVHARVLSAVEKVHK